MKDVEALKSQLILNTLQSNVESFLSLLDSVEDDLTKQNILRSIILFACSGIDAIVKQLILETLEYVIERDEGAQEQLRKYTARKLRGNSEFDFKLLAELFTVKDSRKLLIEMLKKELSYDSLQSSEQLFKVASYFNIRTDSLADDNHRRVLVKAFSTRNVIVHQMDVALEKAEIEYFKHDVEEIKDLYETVVTVAQNFINEVNNILKRKVTDAYAPLISVDNGTLIIRNF